MTTATGPQLDFAIPPATLGYKVQYVAHASIFPDPAQPRTDADKELRDSIGAQGIQQPITVRPNPDRLDGSFMIIDGERRWRGAEGILEQVPVIVREDLDERPKRLASQLVSNTGKQLTPLQEARAFAELVPYYGSVAALARSLGRPITSVAERLHLLEIGGWVALVESGAVTMSHAVKALLPYRGCSDAVHDQAIAKWKERRGDDMEPDAHVDDFIFAVDEAYKPMLYPLSKSKNSWDPGPLFDVRKHNDECDCGRITLQRHKGSAKRDWCGNPDWWKPLHAAAKKEERKRAKKKGSSSSSRGGASAKVYYHMPAEASEYKPKSYGDAPKGVVFLTDDYHTKWSAVDFDPSTLKVDPAQLVLVHQMYGGTPRVATKDAAAVKTARDAWATRWRDRHTGIVGALKKSIDSKASGYKVAGAGVAELLVRLQVEPGDLVDVALASGIKVPDTINPLQPGNDLRTAASKWVGALSEKDANTVATGLAMLLGTRTKSPNAKVREEITQAQQEIARKAVPWTKAPKGGAKAKAPAKGRKAAKAEADVHEDIDDEEE